jgi:hypothetical protein
MPKHASKEVTMTRRYLNIEATGLDDGFVIPANAGTHAFAEHVFAEHAFVDDFSACSISLTNADESVDCHPERPRSGWRDLLCAFLRPKQQVPPPAAQAFGMTANGFIGVG